MLSYKRYLDNEYLKATKNGFLESFINKREHFFSSSIRNGLLGIINSTIGNNECVLLPYFCPHGLYLPFSKCPIDILNYKCNPDLSPDEDDILFLINNFKVKFLVLINYFGCDFDFTYLKEITSPQQIILIEDCVHSFPYSKNKNNSYVGDIALISFPKILPVPDGALIIFNNSELFSKIDLYIKNSFVNNIAVLLHKKYIYFKKVERTLKYGIIYLIINNLSKTIYTLYYKLNCIISYPHPISSYSRNIISIFAFDKMIKRRLVNLELVKSQLQLKCEYFINCKSSIFGFPILVKDKQKVIKKLRKNNIELLSLNKYWFFDTKKRSVDNNTERKILLNHVIIPLNESISEAEMKYLINTLNSLYSDELIN